MPFEDSKSHLRDIHDSINLTQEFVRDLNLDAFLRDAKSQAAVERKLLVISEAAVRLGESAETLCPGIPWRDIRGIGNWLRHQYDRINAETVWNIDQ